MRRTTSLGAIGRRRTAPRAASRRIGLREHVAEQVLGLVDAAQDGVLAGEDLHRHQRVEPLRLEDPLGTREVHVGRVARQDLAGRPGALQAHQSGSAPRLRSGGRPASDTARQRPGECSVRRAAIQVPRMDDGAGSRWRTWPGPLHRGRACGQGRRRRAPSRRRHRPRRPARAAGPPGRPAATASAEADAQRRPPRPRSPSRLGWPWRTSRRPSRSPDANASGPDRARPPGLAPQADGPRAVRRAGVGRRRRGVVRSIAS